VTFGIGPAGTGKTWFAAALAAEALQAGDIKTIVIVRPAVEAGENLGFLPGDLNEKVDPFMRPIYDALSERMGSSAMEYAIKAGAIEVRPLAFLRGSTLKDCWVLADEMQNTTPAQMKMFLTRIGENSRFIVNGDLSQTDIEGPSGLADALRRLDGLRFVAKVEFTTADIVRDPICQAIAERYEIKRNPDSQSYIASNSDNALKDQAA
jgi:phosphate starvation-inducible PhoH-like protein